MLTLPVYLRGNTYYLHTRFLGKQVKKSLYTNDKQTAIIKASSILKAYKMGFDWDKIATYKMDTKNGVYESDGSAKDHKNLMEAMAMAKSMQANPSSTAPQETVATANIKTGLKTLEVLDKMLRHKTKYKPATVLSYRTAITEFSTYTGNLNIADILVSDITRYQDYLSIFKNNDSRTIDNKVAILRSLINFAIKQGYFFKENPAKERAFLSKREREQGGYAILELPEMKRIFDSEYMRIAKIKDPDYYWCLVLATFSGCRISEITSLTKDQLQDRNNILFLKIRDSKTKTGIREVPIPSEVFNVDFNKFIEGKTKLFKYLDRLGKGSGGAVSQKFKRHMAICAVSRPKLVLHSVRKFLNDYFSAEDVALEPRCQFMGHEINSVNTLTYKNPKPVAIIAKAVNPAQIKLATDLKIF